MLAKKGFKCNAYGVKVVKYTSTSSKSGLEQERSVILSQTTND